MATALGGSTGGTTARGGSVGTGGVVGLGGRAVGEGGTSGSGGGTRVGGRTGSGGAVVGAGAGGSPGGASGGNPGMGGSADSGDDYVSDVKVAVHPQTNTILVVTWTQRKASDKTLLEFGFADGESMTSRGATGTVGAHRDVVLGVPEKTVVGVRIVNKVGSVDFKTKDYTGTTGAIPSGLPKPKLVSYDASLASPEPWLLGAVENSPGGCDNPSCYYVSTF